MAINYEELTSEVRILADIILKRMGKLHGYLLGDTDYTNDSRNSIYALLSDNLPIYINTISKNIETLYLFIENSHDISYLADAGNALKIISPLLDFACASNETQESQFGKLIMLHDISRAKLKIHTEKTITVTDLALLANITAMGVIQAIKRKQLNAKKLGNLWFIDSKDALDWLVKRA